MYKELDSLHEKILNSKFAEEVTEQEILALVEAKEIRAKAIDEFALFMSNYIDENQYGCVDDLLYRLYTTMLEIAEQMKAGGMNES